MGRKKYRHIQRPQGRPPKDAEKRRLRDLNTPRHDPDTCRGCIKARRKDPASSLSPAHPPQTQPPLTAPQTLICDVDYRTSLDYDWTLHVQCVENTVAEANGLFGIVRWDDSIRAIYPLELIRRRCPKKLLQMYERQIIFEN